MKNMGNLDVRWLQRFENYTKALNRLEEAADIIRTSSVPQTIDLLKEGFIQRFEFTQELAWKVMKDYLEYQGENNISGSRDAFRKALASGIISNPMWLETISTRNITSHTYDEDITSSIFSKVISDYMPLMKEFETKMIKIKEDENL